jgi:hypothetical protein
MNAKTSDGLSHHRNPCADPQRFAIIGIVLAAVGLAVLALVMQ